jgi:hypothetical protein
MAMAFWIFYGLFILHIRPLKKDNAARQAQHCPGEGEMRENVIFYLYKFDTRERNNLTLCAGFNIKSTSLPAELIYATPDFGSSSHPEWEISNCVI